MPFRKSFCLLAMSAFVASAGCSSGRSMTSWNRWLAGNDKPAANDPLVGNKADLSNEFKTAQKGLHEPDKALLAFARWKEDMGQHAEAKQRYHEILTADPENLSARLGIARIEFVTGRVAEAQRILHAAAERSPDSAEVWVELGRIQAHQESWNEAIASFQKATDINESDQVARYELGIAYARAGFTTEALSHLDYAVGKAAALYNVGYVLHEQSRDQDAAVWFHRALSSHPDGRTKSQAERMLARTGVDPSGGNMPLAGRPQTAAQPFAQTQWTPQIRPTSSSSMPSIVSQSGSVSQPNIVQRASSTTTVNGHPAATADYLTHQQPTPTMPQSFSTQMPVVAAASRGRANYNVENPPQWTGPQYTQTVASESAASGQFGSTGPVEPEQWRAHRQPGGSDSAGL